jgi:hypothetical protein
MREDDRIQLSRIKSEVAVALIEFFATTLKETAFQEEFTPIHLYQVLGSCYSLGCSIKRNSHFSHLHLDLSRNESNN